TAQVGDFRSASLAKDFDLVGCKSQPPERAIFAFALVPGVEMLETGRVLEPREVQLASGAREVTRLGEDLHQLACPVALLAKGAGESIDVVVTIAVVLRGELADRAVIQDRAAGQHVVAIPAEPVEDVFLFADR